MASATSDAKRRLSKLLRAPDPKTPKGREQRLGEIQQLSASITKEAELVELDRTMDARRREAMDAWARAPGVGDSRRRDSEPPEREALRKIAYLLRGGFPKPLEREAFSYNRLSKKESLELLDLTQRAMQGGAEFTENDNARKDALLEKACGASPGAIARWHEEMVLYDFGWARKAEVEAFEQAEAEFKVAEAKFAAARNKVPPALWERRF